MKTPRKLSNIEALSYYRAVLSTAGTVSDISLALQKNGYTQEVLKEGHTLLDKAKEIYDRNLLKKDELAEARLRYTMKKKEIEAMFRIHRNKALLIFKNYPRELKRLAIDGKYPRTHDHWFETLRKFYTLASKDRKIRLRLERLQLTGEEIESGLKSVLRLENLYAAYLKHKGESQHMTIVKDSAFDELHDWMVVFFSLARLSLKGSPALMSSLARHLQV